MKLFQASVRRSAKIRQPQTETTGSTGSTGSRVWDADCRWDFPGSVTRKAYRPIQMQPAVLTPKLAPWLGFEGKRWSAVDWWLASLHLKLHKVPELDCGPASKSWPQVLQFHPRMHGEAEPTPLTSLEAESYDFPGKTWVIKCPHWKVHPTIRYMVYSGYYKVMSNIPKMGQLPTPARWH